MRVRPGAVLLGLAALLLTGCVSVPDSGPVVQTRPDGGQTAGSGVYIDPKPPQPGDTRPDIVRGFLAAMQATPIETKTAREFLSEDAAASWDPQKQTITYAVPPTPEDTDAGVSVTLSEPHRLNGQGAWKGSIPRGRRTITFPMVMEDGQWRIDAAPDALIVPESWFADRYRQVSLYFFDPTATMLVPEPVYVPRGEALASTLTRSLLMGPGQGLARVIQSFVPSGLKYAVGVAVSDDGIANISLTGDAGTLTPKSIELMMAQFAWTLRQEPSVQGIRVSIDGDPVPLPGGVSSYRVDGGDEYDPAGFQASPLLYGLRNGMVASGTLSGLTPVGGPLGDQDLGFDSIGVDLTADEVAGVGAKGTDLVVGPLSDSQKGRVRTVLSGATDLLRPAWDFADRIWLVDRTDHGARVSYVEGSRVTPIDVPGVTGEKVRSFVVSRDGSRLVAVIHGPDGDELVVSRIEHAGAGRVLGATRARRIFAEDEVRLPIRAIAWRSPTSLSVLSPFPQALTQVRTASVDGSPVGQDTAVEGRLRALAGSPVADEATYGVTARTLVDLSSSDTRTVPLTEGTTQVGYVG